MAKAPPGPSPTQASALDAAVGQVYNNDPAVRAATLTNGQQAPANAFVNDMSAGDKLIAGAGGSARTSAQGVAAGQATANAGLNTLQGNILGSATPGQSLAQTVQGSGPVGNTGFVNPASAPHVATAGGPVLSGAAAQTPQGLYTTPAPNAMAAGVGQGKLDEVDAALTGYNPNFKVPGTGTMAAAPGTVGLGALPGQVAAPGLQAATDRTLQTQQLDRVLGFNPQTASVAEAQLHDAAQQNLGQSLALARSARGGPAAQAQAMRNAQSEGAATMSQASRDLATLRAQEEDTAKQRELTALGLGNEQTSSIRGSDVTERGQNATSLDNALTAGVSQRGQDVNAQVAGLNAGVTQRGQTIDQAIAERNAGVTERGQTTTANQAMSKDQLDAIIARQQGAVAGRTAATTERGQTLDAVLGTEQVKSAHDQIASSSLTAAEQTEANVLVNAAALGNALTPEQQMRMQALAIKAGKPGLFQQVVGGIQAVGDLGMRVATAVGSGGASEAAKAAGSSMGGV